MAIPVLIFGLFLQGVSFGPAILIIVTCAILPFIALVMACAAIWPPDMSGHR